jgi:GGDEF domain-containing protein
MFWDLRTKARAQKAAYEKELALQHLAHFDDLTGLPNPVLFRDRLSVALAMSRRQATELEQFH